MTRQAARHQLEPQKHHPGLIFLSTLAISLLGLSVLLATTVLSPSFTSRVLTRGPAPELLQETINQTVQENGAPADLVTKHEARQLLKTAVRQVYSGQPINLDLGPIETRLVGQVGAVTGLPADLIGGAAATMVGNQLTTAVNEQVNPPAVRTLTVWITTARRVNQVALVLLGGLVMLCVLIALIRPTVQASVVLSWSLFWALCSTAGLVGVLATNSARFVADPLIGPVVADLVLAICQRGWQLVLGFAILTLVALGSRLMTSRMLEKRSPV